MEHKSKLTIAIATAVLAVLGRGVGSGVIEETARPDESFTPIPLKHLASF